MYGSTQTDLTWASMPFQRSNSKSVNTKCFQDKLAVVCPCWILKSLHNKNKYTRLLTIFFWLISVDLSCTDRYWWVGFFPAFVSCERGHRHDDTLPSTSAGTYNPVPSSPSRWARIEAACIYRCRSGRFCAVIREVIVIWSMLLISLLMMLSCMLTIVSCFHRCILCNCYCRWSVNVLCFYQVGVIFIQFNR